MPKTPWHEEQVQVQLNGSSVKIHVFQLPWFLRRRTQRPCTRWLWAKGCRWLSKFDTMPCEPSWIWTMTQPWDKRCCVEVAHGEAPMKLVRRWFTGGWETAWTTKGHSLDTDRVSFWQPILALRDLCGCGMTEEEWFKLHENKFEIYMAKRHGFPAKLILPCYDMLSKTWIENMLANMIFVLLFQPFQHLTRQVQNHQLFLY